MNQSATTATRAVPSIAASSAQWRLEHAIGGRFLTQPQTGVQRYAAQVVRALDDLLAESGGRAEILAPKLENPPTYRAIDMSVSSVASGHVWEQAVLPLSARRPLLSLCNTGPLIASEQILCIHDANVFRVPDSYSRKFRTVYRFLSPRLARRVARLTTVSFAAREDLANFFSVSRDDIAVLPNGHEHVFEWRADRSDLRGKVEAFRPFVLLLGSTARHKNLDRVLSLAEALDAEGIDIAVAGGGGAIFTGSAVKARANVHVLGRVSDHDLALLYQRALCLAFPSRAEGFGLPLLESMALGCPAMAANIPSSLEVCGQSALFAAPDDGEAWLSGLKKIAKSEGLRSELAEQGRARARRFSWRQTAQGYLDLAKSQH